MTILIRLQRDWVDVIATSVRAAVAGGEFRADIDPTQFAQEMYGLALSHYHFARLLGDPSSEARTRAAFEALVERSRASAS